VGAFTLANGWQLYLFPIFIGISVIIGLVWVYEKTPARQANLFWDTGVGILLGTLLGSRIGYVIFQWNYFKYHLIEMPQFQLGGYSWVGAVLGWMASIFMASRVIPFSILELSDAFLNLAGSLTIGVWLGCMFEGVAYGFLSESWWAQPVVDEWGEISYRFPVQLIGAIFSLLFLMLLDGIKAHPDWKQWLRQPGKLAALFLSGLSLIILFLTFFRGDPAPLWIGRRVDTWLSLGFFVSGMTWLGVITIKQKISANKRDLSTYRI
jgi:prolipoprotein diacylglyceryltransferase